jgi:hypothetical protein
MKSGLGKQLISFIIQDLGVVEENPTFKRGEVPRVL